MVVWRSKVQIHSMRWDAESSGAEQGDGQMWVVVGCSCVKRDSSFPKGFKVSLFLSVMHGALWGHNLRLPESKENF